MNKIKKFEANINQIFSNSAISKFSREEPIELGTLSEEDLFINENVNHYQIKQKNKSIDELIFSENELSIQSIEKIKKLIKKINNNLTEGLKNEIYKRNIYITTQTKEVRKNGTSRVSGWHLDGMQGSEIQNKTKGCFQILTYNKLPTEFCIKEFNTSNLNRHKNNYFKAFGNQITKKDYKLGNIRTYPKNTLLLMNVYHVHQCKIAKKDYDNRKFLRIYITYSNITTNKMTINSNLIGKYDYDIHMTNGEIPSHLT